MAPSLHRISQRAPKSCEACRRRKQKCSKQIPCTNCVSRGRASECRRETVILSKAAARTEALLVDTATPDDGVPHLSPPITQNSADDHDLAGDRDAPDNDPDSPDSAFIGPDTVGSLESVVWGSHGVSSASSKIWTTQDIAAADNITARQEQMILDFHRDQISWLHNVVHLGSFKGECRQFRGSQRVASPSWRTLYYAMMSTGLYYMGRDLCTASGIQGSIVLSKALYWKTLEALNEADFMAVHTLHALQSICVILPCAYAYGDSKRIIALLSTANCIAQLMQIHLLDEEPAQTSSKASVLQHEIAKRVWCFLVIQDSYLISFKKTYSICQAHAKTPLPKNCPEPDDSPDLGEHVMDSPLSTPTPTTYMILQARMLGIKRRLHDSTFSPDPAAQSVADRYRHVVQADESLDNLRRELPLWMMTSSYPTEGPPWMQNQWRTFRISFSHMRLSIHRAFFCESFVDKQYCYSQVACLSAARLLLQTYHDTAPSITGVLLVDSWTIPPHVISASIILALNILFSGNMHGFDPHGAQMLANDKDMMTECLGMIGESPSSESSRLIKRGRILVEMLLEESDRRRQSERVPPTLCRAEIVRLVRQVETTMQADDQASLTALNLSFEDFLSIYNGDCLEYM